MKKVYNFLLAIVTISIVGCGSGNTGTADGKSNSPAHPAMEKQLNITILLDLSNRIDTTANPSNPQHYKRDIEIVQYFTEIFKKDMEAKGAFAAKGKVKVIFSPNPQDPEINNIASQLMIDLSKVSDNREKKRIFDNISANFHDGLTRIYGKTLRTNEYIGSDIWRFFRNDVVDYCIDNEDNRNILVIVTDGYVYHPNSIERNNNRTAFLTRNEMSRNGLRDSNWEERFKEGDYGYITSRDDLNRLDVLVLEVAPTSGYQNDEYVLKAYWQKWLSEMNVNSYQIYSTDLPVYTKTRIDQFIYE
jgi:hypothetical protein